MSNRVVAAALAALATSLAPAEAAKLTNSEFMKLSAAQRYYYYAGAFDVLGHWTSLNYPDKSKCVWGWLFDKPKERTALLEKSFKLYPDHAPSSVILSLIQRDCGVTINPASATKN